MNRKLTLFLALLLLTGSTAACAEKAEDEASVTIGESMTETEAEETRGFDTLQRMDYEGYVFHILHENQADQQVDIITEGKETGDVLNDLVFRRNKLVEETYNITIEADAKSMGEVNNMIIKTVTSGMNDFDLYFQNCTAVQVSSAGYLYSLDEMPNINLDNPWWDKAALNDLSINGQLFMATGDISPTSLLTSSCLVFNKALFTDYNMEYPYDLIRNNQWTLDKMAEMTKGLTTDMNGDDRISFGEDLYGYSGWWQDNPYALFYGAGGMLSAKDSDDIPYVHYDMERITAIFDKIYTIVRDNNSYFVTNIGQYSTVYENFSKGNAFFCDITLLKIDMTLREMEQDFGIIPNPKYDENQDDYIACVNGAGNFIVIPNNPFDAEMTGLITEALAASAYDSITPSLYDVIVKSKNVRDIDSVEMLDLVIGHRVFDPCFIYTIPGYTFSQDLLGKNSKDVASTLQKYQKSADRQLQKLVDAHLNHE